MNGDILIEYRKKNGFYIKLHNNIGKGQISVTVYRLSSKLGTFQNKAKWSKVIISFCIPDLPGYFTLSTK